MMTYIRFWGALLGAKRWVRKAYFRFALGQAWRPFFADRRLPAVDGTELCNVWAWRRYNPKSGEVEYKAATPREQDDMQSWWSTK